MPTRNATTYLAILAGSLSGGAAALFGVAAEPSTSDASSSEAEVPSPSAEPTSSATGSQEVDNRDAAPTLEVIDVAEAERACARGGAPRDCLTAAQATGDAGRGRLFESLAVSQWTDACIARDPEACHELGKLHEQGIGVPASAQKALGLRQRARELCEGKTSEFCDTLHDAGR